MSTDTFSDLETRLRSDLPRLADALATTQVDADPRWPTRCAASNRRRRGRGRRRRWLVPALAVAAVVLVLLGARARGAVGRRPRRRPGRRRPGAGRVRVDPDGDVAAQPSRGGGLGVDRLRGDRLGRPGRLHGAARRRRVRPGDRHVAHDHAELLGPSRRPRGVDRHRDGRAGQERRRRLRPRHRHLARPPAAPDGGGSFLAPVWTGDRAPRHRRRRRRERLGGQPDAPRRSAEDGSDLGGRRIDRRSRRRVRTVPDYRSCGPARRLSCWDPQAGRGWAYDPSTDAWRSSIPVRSVEGLPVSLPVVVGRGALPRGRRPAAGDDAGRWSARCSARPRTAGRRSAPTVAGPARRGSRQLRASGSAVVLSASAPRCARST